MLRAIIVDDESLSVKRLNRILAETGEVTICQTFLSPLAAYEYVRDNPVDVAFLDVSMPEVNGMTLSQRLHELSSGIDVVFVTGYEEYAVEAFDISATDYLLKPVSAERVAKTLRKIRKRSPERQIEPALIIQLFGGLKLYRTTPERSLLKLRSPKTEELFAFLLYKRAVSRDEIIDTLWGEFDSEKASNNLNSHLHYIRKALGDSGLGNCLVADRGEVRIAENGMACDLYAFERLHREIKMQREGRMEKLKQATQLYTGSFLQGKPYEWASQKARRLEQNYVELLELSARLYLEHQQEEAALMAYADILRLDALREDIAYHVIRLLINLGRSSEAVRQYRLLEELLQQELGTRPGRPLREMMHKLNP